MELPSDFFNHDAQAGGFYPRAHVGIDISSYGVRQNVLIEGIRGTGKTHVMKMIERYYFENFDTVRILPIYVSLAQINEHARKVPDEFRLHLCTHIVQRCLETVEKYQDEIQPGSSLIQNAMESLRKLFGFGQESTIDAMILDLKKVAEQLLFELQFDLTSEAFRSATTSSTKLSSQIGSSLKTYSLGVKSELSSNVSGELTTANEIEGGILFMGSRLAHKNASNFILEFLKQLQVIFDLQYSLILLDEISEAAPSAQVEVFRLFKAIRGAVSIVPTKEICTCFIGSVYPRGETYYPTRNIDGFGFDPGQDCTMDFIQWDESDLETYTSFFQDMTLKRSQEMLNYDYDWLTLSKELFDQEDTFFLAAYCSHGIPRRYWEFIKRGYDPVSRRITLNRVEVAIQEIVNDQILAHASIDDRDINFVYHLVRILESTNRVIRRKNKVANNSLNPIPQNIYFSVNHRYRDTLRRLLMQGAIHDKSRMRTVTKPKRPQPMFAVDMSIIFTYRIIPPKKMVRVIQRDIPRLPASDFAQAPEIIGKTLKEIYDEGVEVHLDIKSHDEDDLSGTTRSNIVGDKFTTGIVMSYISGKKGEIIPDNKTSPIPFQFNNIVSDSKSKINIGSKVTFSIRVTPHGEIARMIRVLDSPQTDSDYEGVIKSYKVGQGGLIDVLDGRQLAFFEENNLDEQYLTTIRPGDRVTFSLVITQKGRQALRIRPKKVEVDHNKTHYEEIASYIIAYVQDSDSPVSLAKLATQIINHFGDAVSNTQWHGYDSFKQLLLSLDLNPLVISPYGPSYIFDPALHATPGSKEYTVKGPAHNPDSSNTGITQRSFEKRYPEFGTIAREVSDLTGLPLSSPEEYAFIFNAIAKEVNLNGFQISKTQINIRDICRANGIPMARAKVNRIFIQIHHSGHKLGNQNEQGITIGNAVVDNVVSFLRFNGRILDPNEQWQLRTWLTSKMNRDQAP